MGTPDVSELRTVLAEAGWSLTELAGDSWIIYGYKGTIPLCVMAATRLEAWQQAMVVARALGLSIPRPQPEKVDRRPA